MAQGTRRTTEALGITTTVWYCTQLYQNSVANSGGQELYERLTISEAAKRLGISTEGVRQRVKRNAIEHERDPETGRTFVYLYTEEEANTPQNGDNRVAQEMRAQILELKEDKEHLRAEVMRCQQIIAGLVGKLPDPQEQPQESVVLRELTGAAQEVGEKAVRGLSRWRQWFR